MEKEFTFSFIQRPLSCWDIGTLGFWAFQKGKILPVALIELTPLTVVVSDFKGEEAEMQKLKEAFKQFSGCSI